MTMQVPKRNLRVSRSGKPRKSLPPNAIKVVGGFYQSIDDIKTFDDKNFNKFINTLNICQYPKEKLLNPMGFPLDMEDAGILWQYICDKNGNKIPYNNFANFGKKQLCFKWDDLKYKQVFSLMDENEKGYITYKQYQKGIESFNSDLRTYFQALLVCFYNR